MQKKSKIQITYHKKTELLLQFGRRYSEQSFGAFILHLPCLVTQNTNILFDGTIKYIYLVWKIFLFRDRLLALINLIIFCILSNLLIVWPYAACTEKLNRRPCIYLLIESVHELYKAWNHNLYLTCNTNIWQTTLLQLN